MKRECKNSYSIFLISSVIFLILIMPFVSANAFTDFFEDLFGGVTGKVVGQNCLDTDGGKNYDVQGRCSDKWYSGGLDEICYGPPTYNYVKEFYCDTSIDECRADIHLCPNGCSNGVCSSTCIPKTCFQLGKQCGDWDNGCGTQIQCGICPSGQQCTNGACVSTASCSDSDGGLNYDLKGTCNNGTSVQDYCSGTNTLKEYRCIERDCMISSYDCSSVGKVCSDGVCISGSNCTNGCTSGSKRCNDNNVETCGNYDPDSCTEWGGSVACSAGLICSDGVCISNSSTCIPSTCSELGKQCGSWGNGCGGVINCGINCPTGQSCNSNGQCVSGTAEVNKCSDLSNEVKNKITELTNSGKTIILREGAGVNRGEYAIINAGAGFYNRIIQLTSTSSGALTPYSIIQVQDALTGANIFMGSGLTVGKSGNASTNIDGQPYYFHVKNRSDGSTVYITWGAGASYNNPGTEIETFYNCNPVAQCTDSDGGLNYNVKGNIYKDGEIIYSEIVSGDELIVLSKTNAKLKLLSGIWINVELNGNYNFEFGEGKVTEINFISANNRQNNIKIAYTKLIDVCFDNTLDERICGSPSFNVDNVDNVEYVCPNGCSDGACISTNTTTCSDSDGGLNYLVKGTCSQNGIANQDLCLDANTLKEYRCSGNCVESLYNCKDINKTCIDGACVEKSCAPIYSCVYEPSICPSSGIQIKKCKDSECNNEDYEGEVNCNPGECSGCERENKCLPFGTRLGFENINYYCDIDGEFKVQRTVNEEGSWANCQNNYECESNLCSSGECIEITKMISEYKGFKATVFKIMCRVADILGIDEYEKCVADSLGGSSNQDSINTPENNNKCSTNEIFDPYNNKCISKSVTCQLDKDCLLLEGQTASFTGEDLLLTLISADEGQIGSADDDKVTIDVEGFGQVDLESNFENSMITFGNYVIVFETADGDQDKIMGAEFEVTKSV